MKWSYTTGAGTQPVQSSPAVANGVVYVGSDDYKVYALNPSTGALPGSFTTGDIVETAPVMANGVVYIGANDFNVYALNASIGALLWSYATSFFVAILARGGKWGGLCRLVRRDKCSLSNYTLSLGDVLMRYALSEKASAPGLQRGRAAHVGTPPQIAHRAEEAYGTRGDLAGLGRWSE